MPCGDIAHLIRWQVRYSDNYDNFVSITIDIYLYFLLAIASLLLLARKLLQRDFSLWVANLSISIIR